jgi:hypothetical protein
MKQGEWMGPGECIPGSAIAMALMQPGGPGGELEAIAAIIEIDHPLIVALTGSSAHVSVPLDIDAATQLRDSLNEGIAMLQLAQTPSS